MLSHALGDDVKLLDGDTLSDQMGKGANYDSPRGRWKFDEQGPLQNVYLRKVQDAGGTLVNAVLYRPRRGRPAERLSRVHRD